VYESCIINGITIRRTQKNKLPNKTIKSITIKWTNQWKRFEDETSKLKPPDKKKPPDKQENFELTEDHIHKRKIKLR
jgi:hypothetical protein